MENNEGVKLKCPRCGNVWVYKGKNKYVAPCSYCKNSVAISTNKEV